MRLRDRLLFSGYISLLVYLVVISIIGQTGILESIRLNEARVQLKENIASIELLNRQRSDRIELLRRDPETLIVAIRQLNYLREGEGVVAIGGMSNQDKGGYKLGREVSWARKESSNRLIVRAIAMLVGMLVFFLLSMIAASRKKERTNGNGSS